MKKIDLKATTRIFSIGVFVTLSAFFLKYHLDSKPDSVFLILTIIGSIFKLFAIFNFIRILNEKD